MSRYDRSYGAKYNDLPGSPGWVDTTVIAKAIRADIKAAVKAGDIPGVKYSVRTSKFSGGSSIDVEIIGLPNARVERAHPYGGTVFAYSDETSIVVDKVKAMVDAYNHDGSDSMTDYFDVRFYGHVSVDWRASVAVGA
jgi:hypothetical protein